MFKLRDNLILQTDTASVLQEACISIKALQDQIQVLKLIMTLFKSLRTTANFSSFLPGFCLQNLCNAPHLHSDHQVSTMFHHCRQLHIHWMHNFLTNMLVLCLQKARDENEAGLRDKGLCLVPVSLSQKVADQDLFSQMFASMSCFTA